VKNAVDVFEFYVLIASDASRNRNGVIPTDQCVKNKRNCWHPSRATNALNEFDYLVFCETHFRFSFPFNQSQDSKRKKVCQGLFSDAY